MLHCDVQDRCTVEGIQTGTLPPGVSTGTKPLGTCYAQNNCASSKFDCDTSDGKNLCSCNDGQDVCKPLGICKLSRCAQCEKCVQDFQLFPTIVRSEASATNMGARFSEFCVRTARRSSPVCQTAASAISASIKGNKGRRVAAICSALNECRAEWNCSVSSDGSATTALLDLCTEQGVATGVSTNDPLPGTNTCINNTSCGAGYQCNKGIVSTTCTCSAGNDLCTDYGVCEATQCTQCNKCVAQVQSFVRQEVARNHQNGTAVALDLGAFCAANTNMFGAATCSSVGTLVAKQTYGNTGIRAGALCMLLGKVAQLCAHLRSGS